MRTLYVTNGFVVMSIGEATFDEFNQMIASLPDDPLSYKKLWTWDVDKADVDLFELYPEDTRREFATLDECERYIANKFEPDHAVV